MRLSGRRWGRGCSDGKQDTAAPAPAPSEVRDQPNTYRESVADGASFNCGIARLDDREALVVAGGRSIDHSLPPIMRSHLSARARPRSAGAGRRPVTTRTSSGMRVSIISKYMNSGAPRRPRPYRD